MDNDFGGKHTQIKLRALKDYLPAYTTALKGQRFRLTYIDAFAGSGSCLIDVGTERKIRVPGSAAIGLECRPPFDQLVFIDKRKRCAQALARLSELHRDRKVEVVRGDANRELLSVLAGLDRSKDRAVLFLDPFGMSVEWRTLQAIRATKLVDVWYLFPLFGLYRQAANQANKIDAAKEASITRMVGTDAWRHEFYNRNPQADMFGAEQEDVRILEANQMAAWVTDRLRSLFPRVENPAILYAKTRSGKNGAPLFALYFAVSNPSPAAGALASRIARHVLKR